MLLNSVLFAKRCKEITERNFHYISTAAAFLGCELLSTALKKIKVSKTKKDQSPSSKPYACHHDGCGKSYDQKQKLDAHKITHGPKEFICDEPDCDAKFHFKSHLKRHYDSVHSGKKPYHCTNEGCGARTNSDLKKHLGYEHIKCPFSDCHATMPQKLLIKHKKEVHNEKNSFSCTRQECPFV